MGTPAPFEGFPFVLGWEFTVACNLRCLHCGSSAGTPRNRELDTKEALALCDQLPELLVQEVDFTGGEPLLRPDWSLVVSRIARLGIAANLLTNGLALDADLVGRMADAGVGGVGISLDGLEPTHDATRAHRGSFASVLRSFALMDRAGLPYNVITTVNARNLSELPAMLDLLLAAGVRAWRLQAIIPMGRAKAYADLPLGPDGILELGTFIQQQRARLDPRRMQLICSDGLEYIVDEEPGERPWKGCSAGVTACGITSDGRVKGCLSMPDELTEGDLRERSLWDIWFDPDAFPYTRQFSLEKLGPGCRGCEKAEVCRGGCTSSSYCGSGQFHNDPACFHRARLAGAAPPELARRC